MLDAIAQREAELTEALEMCELIFQSNCHRCLRPPGSTNQSQP
jgi:hypothetical protein